MSVTSVENYPAIIGGEKVNGNGTFEVVNPSTGQG